MASLKSTAFRVRVAVLSLLCVAAAVAVGCTPAAQAPAPTATQAPAAKPVAPAQPAESKPAAAAPQATTAPARPSEQEEWDKLVAAAKQEGKLVMAGPTGEDIRKAITEPFEQKFGIGIEYLGVGGPELPPRIQKEREAGLYQWDVIIGGTSTLITGIRPLKAVDPIEPVLLLSEVKDPKNWRGGKLPFFDNERIGLSMNFRGLHSFYANTDQVNIEEFTTWRVLLDPKWKGKIVIGRDPRVSGYGQALFQFFYINPTLGPEFIRELLTKQEPQILRDDRTAAQWLAQGRYPLCVCSETDGDRLAEEGLPVKVLDPHKTKEGTGVTSSNSNIALVNRAPHPNAAKLYINWVLSKEGNTLLSKARGDPSPRVDVENTSGDAWAIPDPSWPLTSNEDGIIVQRDKLDPLLKEILGAN